MCTGGPYGLISFSASKDSINNVVNSHKQKPEWVNAALWWGRLVTAKPYFQCND